MKHISVLALYDATLTSLDGCVQMLSRVNDYALYVRKSPFFEIEVVGLAKEILLGGKYIVKTDRVIGDVSATDLIFIPITCNDFQDTIRKNKALVRYCRRTF